MFCFEFGEVLHVVLVGICFAICRELNVILFLVRVGLCLERILFSRAQLLPAVTDKFCDLGEGKILVLDFLTDFVGKDDVGRRGTLRCILIRFRMAAVFPLGFWGRS